MLFAKPPSIDQKWVVRYGGATLFVAAAVVFTCGLWLLVDRPASAPLLMVAIVLSAWRYGIRVGFYASLLAGFAIDYFFIQPYYEFSGTRDEIVRVGLFLIEGCVLSWLMGKLRTATDDVVTSREELRALTKHLESLREAERKRIALEIHDELGQRLTGLKMSVRSLHRRVRDAAAREEEVLDGLDDLAGKVDDTIATVRRISSELRPAVLDDFGLVAASEWQVRQFEKTTKIKCAFESDFEDLDLGAESNSAIFRVLQEALTNVARHAKATSVAVELRKTLDAIVVRVADDGKGIDVERLDRSRTLGVIGMRERSHLVGGELAFSRPGMGGTLVELRIPVAASSLNAGGK